MNSDTTRLRLIRAEIERGLDASRQVVEAFAERGEDAAGFGDVVAELQRIRGGLQMVELHGAALLAEEMEQLARALGEGGIAQVDDACSALMHALLQMPAYFDRLDAGGNDNPVVLLPALNDLRAARGAELLSDNVLFNPDLSVLPPGDPDTGAAPAAADPDSVVQAAQRTFQQGLLTLLKYPEAGRGPELMGQAVVALRAISPGKAMDQLWWISAAVIEGLSERTLEGGLAVRQLLSKVERQISRILQDGVRRLDEAAPRELLKNLLYYVAKANPGSPRVDEINLAFGLAEALPTEGGTVQSGIGFTALSRDTLEAAATILKEELGRAKDALDLFVRSEAADAQTLAPVRATLREVGDTLVMLGMTDARAQIQAQMVVLEEVLNGSSPPEETALVEVAGALLAVEQSLDDAVLGGAAGESDETPGGKASDEAQAVALSEAIRSLGWVKEQFSAFPADDHAGQKADELAGVLDQVAGVLAILNQEQAAVASRECAGHVRRIAAGPVAPAGSGAEHFAEALSALEGYLEGMQQGYRDPALLEMATERIQAAASMTPEEPPGEGTEDGRQSVAATLPGGVDTGGGAPGAGAADVSVPASPDPELMEIFAEESREVLAAIDESLAAWRADRDDSKALADIRRSFHTLKGSGRMVGATGAGELAWAVENLLNRVLEGAVPANDAVAGLVDDARGRFPTLLDAFAAGDPMPDPGTIAQLQLACDELAGGRAMVASGAAVGEAEGREPAVADEAGTAAGPAVSAIDAELAQIFVEESRGYLRVIEGFVEQSRGRDHVALVPEVLRALHTLKGSARSVRVDGMAGLASALDDYFKALVAHTGFANPDDVELLADAGTIMTDMVNRIAAGEAEAATPDAFLQRVAAARQDLDALTESEVAAPPVAAALDDLTGVFLSEAREMLWNADQAFQAWLRDTSQHGPVAKIRSEMQSLSDGAEMAGIASVAVFCRQVDEVYGEILAGNVVCDYPLTDWLQAAQDQIAQMLEALESGEPAGSGRELLEQLPAAKSPAAQPGEAAAEAAGSVRPDEKPSPGEAGGALPGEVDEEFLAIFREEAADLLEQAEDALRSWIEQPRAPGAAEAMRRILHTVKGGARTIGFGSMSDLSHQLESVIEAVEDGRVVPEPKVTGTVQAGCDRLGVMLEEASRGRVPEADGALLGRVRSILAPGVASAEEETAPAPPPAEVSPAPAAVRASAAQPEAAAQHQELVRVRADLVDHLSNMAGEMSISRARLEQQVSESGFHLQELEDTVDRLRGQLRRLEIETEAQMLFRHEEPGRSEYQDFDPLELDRFSQLQQLSRSLLESVSDLLELKESLSDLNRGIETLLLQQSRVNTDLHEGLMRARMVPFSSLVPRLRRLVRQLGVELGKDVELRVSGGEGEMDRTVLNRLAAPLEHLLRNAVDHGLETPDIRAIGGKRKTGSIHIRVGREGGEVVLTVSDDGAGIDLGAVRSKAEAVGLLGAHEEVLEQELLQLILEAGFSTAKNVTQISGRGVGMDVVNSEIKQLGGSIYIESELGSGTVFTIRLPFTLSINQALMASVGEEIYAVPLSHVEGIIRIPAAEVARNLGDEDAVFDYAGQSYRIESLGRLLGLGRGAQPTGTAPLPLLLVRSGENRYALQVDAITGGSEIVVKSLGPQLSTVRGVSGATILGDGRVVIILDLPSLIRTDAVVRHAMALRHDEQVEPPPGVLTAMVVDDSITVRKVTSRLLESHGMRSVTAKDGVDAMALLQEQVPDILLVDVEMPRMDGYELAALVRHQDELKDVPIIMITSRSGEKHRQRALDIGVDRYLGKPYQEEELVAAIHELTGK